MPGKEEKVEKRFVKVKYRDGRYDYIRKDFVGTLVACGLIAEVLDW